GTSAPKRSRAWAIWALVSAVDMNGRFSQTPTVPGYRAPVRPKSTVLLALLAASTAPAGAARAAPTALLPDLVQTYPREVQVETDSSSGTPRFHLGFLSAVNNFGAGPLIVHGHRDNAFQPAMTGDQVVKNANGSETVHPNVGSLVYVNAITHQH